MMDLILRGIESATARAFARKKRPLDRASRVPSLIESTATSLDPRARLTMTTLRICARRSPLSQTIGKRIGAVSFFSFTGRRRA